MTEAAVTMHRRPVMSAHGLFHSVPVHHEHMLSVLQVVNCWEGVPVPVLAAACSTAAPSASHAIM